MLIFKNPTEFTLNLTPWDLGIIPPGGEIEVPEYLYRPGRSAGGGRTPSTIESCAPHLVPVAEPEWIAQWRKAPPPPEPKSAIVTSETLRKSPNMPNGVAQAQAERAAEMAKARKPGRPAKVAGPTE